MTSTTVNNAATKLTKRKRKSLEFRNGENKKRKPVEAAEEQATDEQTQVTVDTGKKQKRSPRFILFIGNLPYETDKESLTNHFAGTSPAVRLSTHKEDPSKCKGFAFLEFEGSNASKELNKALLYHHTIFQGRKINVELTGGGGGKGSSRLEKIRAKNDTLNDERHQRMVQHEENRKVQKGKVEKANAADVHPSRRRNLQPR